MIGMGAQNKEAIVVGILPNLLFIDGEARRSTTLEEAPEALVANQAFIAALPPQGL
jgi:hypothetical protein